MNTQRHIASFEAEQERSKELYLGVSCLNNPCKGHYISSNDAIHSLVCDICGSGILLMEYDSWLRGKQRGMWYAIKEVKKEIEYAQAKIDDSKKVLEVLKEKLKEKQAEAKNWR